MNNSESINKNNSIRSDFGAWGWFIVVYAFLSFMFAGNLIVDSLNVTATAFSEMHGWEVGVLLSCSTVAGLISIVASGILSNCVARFGVKIVYSVSLAIVATCCMVWGNVTSIGQYLAIMILVNCFGNGFGFVGGTAIISNWFPQKKGLAMGWATIGFQASAIILLPIYRYLMARFDLAAAYRVVGICLYALLIVTVVFVKNFPEEKGCTPDNDKTRTVEEFQELHKKALAIEEANKIPTSKLLRTKQIWQIGLINGLVQLAVTVYIVQFIPNMIICGFSAARATFIYSIASVVGGVGSYLWGVLDQKIGVKKATVWMCIAHVVAGVLFSMASASFGGKPIAILAAFVVGSILGVSSNYVGSFTAQVFGRYGYASAFALIYMIVCGLRSLGYSLIGMINMATGSNYAAYIIAGILSVLALIITLRTSDVCINPTHQMMQNQEEE